MTSTDVTTPTAIEVAIKNALPVAVDQLWCYFGEIFVGTLESLGVGETWTLSVDVEDDDDNLIPFFQVAAVDAQGELIDARRAGLWPGAEVGMELREQDYFEAEWA